MYTPAHFDEPRAEVLQALIQAHPLGLLVTHGAGGLDANHIPFELEPQHGNAGLLRAHVARANPVWQQVQAGDEVLVVFRAGEAYVSPNWYPSKHEAHRQVPTWNYQAVHVHGRITVHDDVRWVRGLVARLTRRHEAAEPCPWKMGDSAPEFIDGLLAAIVGLEVEITRIEGKRKLSQNKEVRDIEGAAAALDARGETIVSAAMHAAARAKAG